MFTVAAYADVTLNSVRVAAADQTALARFYQSAFGMHEVNRLDTPSGPEFFLNFGATADAAKANKNQPLVIMHRDSNAIADPIAHVIFNVTDMTATVAAASQSRAGGRAGSWSACLPGWGKKWTRAVTVAIGER